MTQQGQANGLLHKPCFFYLNPPLNLPKIITPSGWLLTAIAAIWLLYKNTHRVFY